ncbi:hypothetical protein BH10ACT3_BH10ACT3_13500 [soil metagenome]
MNTLARAAMKTAFVAIIAIVAGACGGGQEAPPDDYGEPNSDGKGYYGNFMYGCTGVQPVDGKYPNPKLGTQQFCRCVYDGLTETVPFDQAKAFDEAQAKARPGEISVPANINRVQEKCGEA